MLIAISIYIQLLRNFLIAPHCGTRGSSGMQYDHSSRRAGRPIPRQQQQQRRRRARIPPWGTFFLFLIVVPELADIVEYLHGTIRGRDVAASAGGYLRSDVFIISAECDLDYFFSFVLQACVFFFMRGKNF